jgi:hypothetical protein
VAQSQRLTRALAGWRFRVPNLAALLKKVGSIEGILTAGKRRRRRGKKWLVAMSSSSDFMPSSGRGLGCGGVKEMTELGAGENVRPLGCFI